MRLSTVLLTLIAIAVLSGTGAVWLDHGLRGPLVYWAICAGAGCVVAPFLAMVMDDERRRDRGEFD